MRGLSKEGIEKVMMATMFVGIFLVIGIPCISTGCNPNVVGGCSSKNTTNVVVSFSGSFVDVCDERSDEPYECYGVLVAFEDEICTSLWRYDSSDEADEKVKRYPVGSQHTMLLYNHSVCDEPTKDMWNIWATGVAFLSLAGFSFFSLVSIVVIYGCLPEVAVDVA